MEPSDKAVPDGAVCDPEAARETRKLRHWIIKGVFLLVSFIVVSSVLALIYDFVFRNGNLSGGLVGEFFGSLMKVLEAMFRLA